MAEVQNDDGCVQILKILRSRDATTPEIRDRANLNIKQVKHRLKNKLSELVEVVGEEKPQQGGTTTDVWSLSSEGEDFVKQQSLKQDLTIEELKNEIEEFRGEIEQTEEELEALKSRVSDRATHSKVDRSIEEVEQRIEGLENSKEFIEGRAREEAKRKAREQKKQWLRSSRSALTVSENTFQFSDGTVTPTL